MTAASLALRPFYLIAGLIGAIAGALFSSLIPLLDPVPPGLVLFILLWILPVALHEPYTAPRAMRAGMLLGLCFGLSQTLLMWLVNINSKVFTGFFIFDRSFVTVGYAVLGGMQALLVHTVRERRYIFALLFLLMAIMLELIALHYWSLRHWLFLPARPYILPFAVTVGLILFFLLYRFYYLKMLGIPYPTRRRNRT
jgi:hypothetical protein